MWREAAGRVVGLVEIDGGAPRNGARDVEKASGAVGLRAVGPVAEDHEIIRLTLLEHGLESRDPSIALQDEGAGTGLELDLPEHVGDGNPAGRIVGLEGGVDAPGRVDREVLQASKPAGLRRTR